MKVLLSNVWPNVEFYKDLSIPIKYFKVSPLKTEKFKTEKFQGG